MTKSELQYFTERLDNIEKQLSKLDNKIETLLNKNTIEYTCEVLDRKDDDILDYIKTCSQFGVNDIEVAKLRKEMFLNKGDSNEI